MLGTTRAWLDVGGVPRTPGRAVQECGVRLWCQRRLTTTRSRSRHRR